MVAWWEFLLFARNWFQLIMKNFFFLLLAHVQWWCLKNVHYSGGKNMAVKVNNDHTFSRLRRASNYIFMCFHHQKWFFMFLSFIFFDGNITTIFRSLSTFLYAPPPSLFPLSLFTLLFYFLHGWQQSPLFYNY